MFKVIKKKIVAENTKEIVVEAPAIASHAAGGQFVILRNCEQGERYPLTIADYDAAGGTITLVFLEIGHSTRRLGEFEVGDSIPDVVGPLGNPTEVGAGGNVICIGGGVGIAAATLGHKHASGVWIPDALLANVNKIHVATLPYETSRLAQEIAGGIAETGCMPSSVDLENEDYGPALKKYLAGASDGETRARAARLVEWLTIGAGVPGCMHGGGSPDGAKLIIRANSDWETAAEGARRLAGITEPLPDPKK